MYYLRNMYQKNLLVAGRLVLDNVPIDLRSRSVYIHAAKTILRRQVGLQSDRYQRAGPFHAGGFRPIAGVVNPPSAKKYQHWLNEVAKNPPTLAEWQAGAVEHPGSWWNDWDKWLSEKSGVMVPARIPGTGGLPAIEDAPGSYVKVRLID